LNGPPASRDSVASARATIERHSKSFALASRLLPGAVAGDAVVLYAYCRRADDAVDLSPRAEQPARLRDLRSELEAVYDGSPQDDAQLSALQAVVRRRGVPRRYLEELLSGMQMDVANVPYETLEELLLYCYRVAGTVGLMMCHVMGVRSPEALPRAAHLGIAMQLTNIARDVSEDWGRGRLYLPRDVLARFGAPDLGSALGGPLPPTASAAVARATGALLDRAEAYYRSGDSGLRHLSARCALAVRTARLSYSRIGARVREQGCSPFAGRAVVSSRRKLGLAARAALETALLLPAAALASRPIVPEASIDDPSGVIFLGGAS
jgi:15-cis-phytoene synthase